MPHVIDLLAIHQDAIATLCRKHGVNRLEVFGSAARGDFVTGTSDVDFVVEFADQNWEGSFKRYMGLKLDLEDLLETPVDLVEPAAVDNAIFTAVAAHHRKVLYAA